MEIAKHHDEKYAYDRVIWKTKLVSEVDGESDDKYRVLQSMKRLTSSRLDLSTPENENLADYERNRKRNGYQYL